MKDLLYEEFDFSQYDPLANINAILEETPYTEDMENGAQQTLIYPKIDYSKVYKSEHLIPGSIEFINHMLQKREKNFRPESPGINQVNL